MARDIRITAGSVVLAAQLNDSFTAKAIYTSLPIRATVQTWGDEIYFPIPVDQRLAADAVDLVEVGDLGYWPTGKAFCIFFGPTPASRGAEVRPASAVNPVGRVLGDATLLRQTRNGDPIVIEAG
jgi:uncharacterized protein